MSSNVTEIVSGGAKGIDTFARKYAIENNLILTEFIPDYSLYGRIATLKRNIEIIDYAYEIIAFWDEKSRGTAFVIEDCKKRDKKLTVYIIKNIDISNF